MTTDPTPPANRAAGDVRDQLLHALDFNYVASLGYGTPEELLAAYDASRASADRAALRDRIADVLAAADGWSWVEDFDKTQSPSYQGYLRQADAVLAVLPPPADRAATLREAADVAESLRQFEPASSVRKAAQVSENVGILRVAEQLRRMADETQSAPAPAARLSPTAVYLATPCDACDHTLNWHRNDVGCTAPRCVCGRFQQPAAGARQDGAQPDDEPFLGDTRRCRACTHDMDAHIRVNGEIACAFEDCTDPTPDNTQSSRPPA